MSKQNYAHALAGHEDAWKNAKVLHRDVSTGNIMILVDQNKASDGPARGMLIDWDMSKYVEELGKGATQHGRSVSMSLNLYDLSLTPFVM